MANWKSFVPSGFEYELFGLSPGGQYEKSKRKLTEQEIDETVIRQAGDDSAWGQPIHAKAISVVPITLSPKLIEKAKIIARRRRMKGYQVWMQRIIRDRIKEEGSIVGNLSARKGKTPSVTQ